MKYKLATILVSIYLVLFLLAILYVELLAPKTAELSGILIIIFALPWIFMFDPHTNNLISIGIPVLINAFILFFVGYTIPKLTSKNSI